MVRTEIDVGKGGSLPALQGDSWAATKWCWGLELELETAASVALPREQCLACESRKSLRMKAFSVICSQMINSIMVVMLLKN